MTFNAGRMAGVWLVECYNYVSSSDHVSSGYELLLPQLTITCLKSTSKTLD